MTTDTTAWTVSVTTTPSPAATLSLSINGGTSTPFTLKGLCYSPCPLNGSNNYAPAIGDWFWDTFSGPGYTVTGWEALWRRDLPNLRTFGINTIRVYGMISRHLTEGGQFPQPWDGKHKFTHKAFLDECWNGGTNPLYVLVGLALPQEMFWLSQQSTLAPAEKAFWEGVLPEMVAEVANHPAVLGFILQNEMDARDQTWSKKDPKSPDVTFWWGQVEKFGAIVRQALGTAQKLIGMAVHDDPNICGQASYFMARVPSLDFWGVNTYQSQNFDPVFQASIPGPGYAGVTGAALKPVILTEWGMPATGHKDAANPATIYADAATMKKAADVITAVLPQAYRQPLCLGLYYFEYSDEWWNQGGSPNIYTWWGGPAAPGFPNGFWDQDGFGLYSIERGKKDGTRLPDNAPIWTDNGPNVSDQLTPRGPTILALRSAFNKASR